MAEPRPREGRGSIKITALNRVEPGLLLLPPPAGWVPDLLCVVSLLVPEAHPAVPGPQGPIRDFPPL